MDPSYVELPYVELSYENHAYVNNPHAKVPPLARGAGLHETEPEPV